jgi:hypothetical protein
MAPIDTQNVIDIIFAATFYTSSDQYGAELGKRFLIDLFDNVKAEHKDDKRAQAYINAIEPIIGSALRAFSVEKLNYKRKILPLERLSKGEEAAINEHIGILPVMAVAKSSSKWSSMLANALFGLVGGSVAIVYTLDETMLALTSYAVIGASIAVLIASIITRTLKAFLIARLIKRTEIQLDKYWNDSYKRYESILMDALISSIRVKEMYYPEVLTFADGHLFPRKELPYLHLHNASDLNPSLRSIAALIDELLEIIHARMSIKPGTNRAEWLKSRSAQ